MSDDQQPTSRRPSAARVIGWSSIFFCSLLAFINASDAKDAGFRVFFIVCGLALLASGVVDLWRWSRQR